MSVFQITAGCVFFLAWASLFATLGFNAGYREGIQIVWTEETLGKCFTETQ
jgi:hypothetical protein